jgi:hypothetical protein
MILICAVCSRPYNNWSPSYLLPEGLKPFDSHGECLKCDVTSNMGEFLNSIGTEDFNLQEDVPENTYTGFVYTPRRKFVHPAPDPPIAAGNHLETLPRTQLNLF